MKDYRILIVALVVYSVNRFIAKPHVGDTMIGYIIKCYLNDYLGGVCFLAYTNVILEHSKYHQMRIAKLRYAIVIMVACGILWEYALPLIYPRGTSDLVDVIAYTLGGSTYVMLSKTTTMQRLG